MRKTDESHLPLAMVDKLISEKKPKFRVLMADCCNAVVEGLSVKRQRSFSTVADDVNESFDVYKNLFKEPEGHIIVTSSSPGEYALGVSSGGLFSMSFLQVLQMAVTAASPITWAELLSATKQVTIKLAEGPQQFTPQYEINLNEGGSSAPTEADELPIDLGSDAAAQLMALIDTNKPMTQRIKLMKELLSGLFANDNIPVSIYAKDGKTLLDRRSAADYVRKLATSSRLASLVEVSAKRDNNGKITEMKVHEFYKKSEAGK